LKETAEAKLQSINGAYMFLSSRESKGGRWQKTKTAPNGPSTNRGTTASHPPKARGAGFATPIAIPSRSIVRALKIVFKFAALILALLLGRYILIAFDVHDSTGEEASKAYDYSRDTVLKGLEGPKRRFLEAVEQDLERFDLRSPAPPALPPAVFPQAAEPVPASPSQAAQASNGKTSTRPSARGQATSPGIRPYITIGSTKAEVLAQQGTPTSASDNKLVYGRSELYFKEGSVVGWRIDPASSPIRVKLWPDSAVDPTMDFFTVGSTRDDVLVVQGTPTAFSQDKFEYGSSEVYFQDNRVTRWKNDPASIPLRARRN